MRKLLLQLVTGPTTKCLDYQSRSCFKAIFFCYLTLSSVYWNQGLHFANFFHALVLFTMLFLAPEKKLFYSQFLFPDSVERVSKPGALFG